MKARRRDIVMKRIDKSSQPEVVDTQKKLFNIGEKIDLKTYKTVRIAVSGDVPLNKLETKIVDTPEFQRLRGIKQLGTTYLVYPTALHTRFDHSLGTLSTAVEMIRAIRENLHNVEEEKLISEEQEQLIRLVALLHDICHIPFGHTLEDEFCIFPRHDKDEERIERFLGKDNKIGKILDESLGHDLYNKFMSIYKTNRKNYNDLGENAFIYDLVNNTVCADLLDYLRRDCYFCNITLDMDYRFLKFLYLRKEAGLKQVVVRLWKEGKPSPRRDVLSELIRLLDNRYLIGERIYFHHAKLITGAMLAGAVQRAKSKGEIRKSQMYELGDEKLLDTLQNSREESVKKLATCIRERSLWKEVYNRTRGEVDTEQAKAHNVKVWDVTKSRWWKDPVSRTNDEESITANLGMSSGDLLIQCPDPDMAMKPAEMKVVWNGELKSLKDCKEDDVVAEKLDVILKSHEKLWSIRAFLNPNHLEKKDLVRNACQYLFTIDHDKKISSGKVYFKDVVNDIVRSDELAKNMLHEEYEKRAEIAVERLVSNTAAERDTNVVRGIVKDAFK